MCGARGIANVFFARCNMQCVFCQNHQISRTKIPVLASPWNLETVVHRVIELLDQGCHMVGFVSPSHFIPQMLAIIKALRLYGRRPTIVMNTNGYDKVSTLRELEEWVDVYLPDIKYLDYELARRWSLTPDYPDVIKASLKEMFRQRGSTLWLREQGLAEKGLIIRHLVMPGAVQNSLLCLRWIAEELSTNIHISLMSQYHPTVWAEGHPQLGRTLYREEYEEVVNELARLGFSNGWVQPLEAHDSYKPDFSKSHPFEQETETPSLIPAARQVLANAV